LTTKHSNCTLSALETVDYRGPDTGAVRGRSDDAVKNRPPPKARWTSWSWRLSRLVLSTDRNCSAIGTSIARGNQEQEESPGAPCFGWCVLACGPS